MVLWRRKQSASSGDSSTMSGAVTPVSSEDQELSKTPSRFMKAFGLRSSSNPKRTPKPPTRDEGRINRPLTQQNLEHQRMFDTFTFSSGRRNSSHGGRSTTSGISPNASRNVSLDLNYLPHLQRHQSPGDRRDAHPRFNNSLAEEAPQEVPGEESDKDTRNSPTGVLPSPRNVDHLSNRRNFS